MRANASFGGFIIKVFFFFPREEQGVSPTSRWKHFNLEQMEEVLTLR